MTTPNTGFQGQFVAQLIGDTEFSYKFQVPKSRRFEGLNNPRLEQQVNAWLDYLMPGVSISANYNTQTGTAQIRVENHFTRGESVIAPNIGFGISYVLPILVTGLIAKVGSFMVVENPEAHLHPSAQSRIGRFLSMIAASGVKVIVETHSDHVVNGIQVAAASSTISSDLVSINFFSQNEEMTQPTVQTIAINKIGELSSWPTGFFDQSQADFKTLLKYRKKDG
jgi:predicted ATPase